MINWQTFSFAAVFDNNDDHLLRVSRIHKNMQRLSYPLQLKLLHPKHTNYYSVCVRLQYNQKLPIRKIMPQE